jgi:D-alanine-D-alanine ligase
MKQIALLFGGRSPEHAVSLASATALLPVLRSLPVHLLLIGVGKDGRLYLCPKDTTAFKEDVWQNEARPLSLHYASPSAVSFSTEGGESFFPDGFFSLIHGTYGEDGALQGALTLAGASFFGSGIAASAIGMHKALSKRLAASLGVPVVPYSYHRVLPTDEDAVYQAAREAMGALGRFPLFVKPCLSGSSIGASVAEDEAALIRAIRAAAAVSPEILVEKYAVGRELELAVWQEEGRIFSSLPAEIKVSGGFYDYQTKYGEGTVKVTVPADLSSPTVLYLQKAAAKLFTLFGCRHLARMDFFYTDSGRLYFNEVNTSPGFTATSMVPRLLALHGKDTLQKLLLGWIAE